LDSLNSHPDEARKSWRPGPRDGLGFGLCWLAYFFAVRRFWFITDDAYISFRYAYNWAHGLGLRYNLSAQPPVEGYSNFLWVALAAVVEKLGLPMPTTMCWLSALCGSVLLWRVYVHMRGDVQLPTANSVALLLPLALFPPFAVWSTSGLATMPFSLALYLAAHEFLWRAEPRWKRAGAILLCIVLLRAEGFLWASGILFLRLVKSRWGGSRWTRSDLYATLVFVVGFGAYWLWRFDYFQRAWPNTVYAKSGLSAFKLQRGLSYVAAQWSDAFLPLLLIPLTICFLWRRRDARANALFAVAGATVVYSVLTGGDFMVMGRFLIPGAALLLSAFAVAAGNERWLRARRFALPLAVVATVLGLWPSFAAPLLPHDFRALFHFRWNAPRSDFRSEFEQWETQELRASVWERLGIAFKDWVEPGSSVVAGAAGAFAYYARVELYDRNGLVTALPASVETDEKRSPGHDRTVQPDFFLDAAPDYALVSVQLAPIEPSEGEERAAFAGTLEWRALRAITDRRWTQQYVPVARPIPKRLHPVGEELALYWRRIGGGESTEEAWQAWRRNVADYVDTGRWEDP
jgi:hypothetical protein